MRLTTAVIMAASLVQPALAAQAAELETTAVQATGGGDTYVADGVLEAVRQTVIAAQVPGRITDLRVKAGDRVAAGQVLIRVDERAAAQQAAASQAQVAAAGAQLDAARREFARSERLYAKKYISQTAMDQAEAQYRASEAQARAMLAQAGVAGTQTSLHTIQAPYAGIVAELLCELGDLAMPGKPLLRLFDPSALRVVATLPDSYASRLVPGKPTRIELPGAPESMRQLTPASIVALPTADPVSHTIQIRLALPAKLAGLTPGMFARAHLPVSGASGTRLSVPASAVVTRTELHAVYVVDPAGRAQLRQVRLGRREGDTIEVLAGVQPGERIARDPVAAAQRGTKP